MDNEQPVWPPTPNHHDHQQHHNNHEHHEHHGNHGQHHNDQAQPAPGWPNQANGVETPSVPMPFVAPVDNSFPSFSQPSFSAPVEPPAPAYTPTPESLMPQAVVKVLSPRGLEYAFMTIALFTSAFALSIALLSLVNGQTSFSVLAFPVAALVVSLPVFALLFLRLKKAELANPALRYDPSKRRASQFTQIFSFVIALFTLIGFLTTIFAKISGSFDSSLVKVFLDVLVIEAIAGGLLAYYWIDEHRN